MTMVKLSPATRNHFANGRSLFDATFDNLFENRSNTPGMRVDMSEREDSYLIYAELPGVKSDNLSVNVEDDQLTISAVKNNPVVENENVYRNERSFGEYSRSFRLGHKVDTEKIDAEYTDGVLKLTLPKREEAKPKSVKVKIK